MGSQNSASPRFPMIARRQTTKPQHIFKNYNERKTKNAHAFIHAHNKRTEAYHEKAKTHFDKVSPPMRIPLTSPEFSRNTLLRDRLITVHRTPTVNILYAHCENINENIKTKKDVERATLENGQQAVTTALMFMKCGQ